LQIVLKISSYSWCLKAEHYFLLHCLTDKLKSIFREEFIFFYPRDSLKKFYENLIHNLSAIINICLKGVLPIFLTQSRDDSFRKRKLKLIKMHKYQSNSGS